MINGSTDVNNVFSFNYFFTNCLKHLINSINYILIKQNFVIILHQTQKRYIFVFKYPILCYFIRFSTFKRKMYKHTNLISKFFLSLFFFLVYTKHDLPPFLFQIKIYTNQKNHQNSHNNHLNRAKDIQMVGNFLKKVLFTHRKDFIRRSSTVYLQAMISAF